MVAFENIQAAESRIRDADMADEMVEFTKNQVLVQSGVSMLAQANIQTQSALRLLGGV
jgi:flagellin